MTRPTAATNLLLSAITNITTSCTVTFSFTTNTGFLLLVLPLLLTLPLLQLTYCYSSYTTSATVATPLTIITDTTTTAANNISFVFYLLLQLPSLCQCSFVSSCRHVAAVLCGAVC